MVLLTRQFALERPACEIVRAKPKVQWRPQEVVVAENKECVLRKASGIGWRSQAKRQGNCPGQCHTPRSSGASPSTGC